MKFYIKFFILFIKYKIIFPFYFSIVKLFSSVDENSVLIDSKGKKFPDDSFSCIIPELEKMNFNIFIYDKRKNIIDDFKFLNKAASSKYIVLSISHFLLDNVSLKQEQVVVNLWHGCGLFKTIGYASGNSKWSGKGNKQNEFFNYLKNTNIFTVSSPFCIPYYCEAIRQPDTVVKALGVSRTDVFFDQNFISKSKEKLLSYFSNFQGKKVILYAPTFRGNSMQEATAPNFLDISFLNKKFSEEYILLLKQHPGIPVTRRQQIPEICKDFAFDVTDVFTISELLVCSDILITDYSSLIFEYSLLERPILLFAPDLDKYNTDRGFFINYFSMVPGPICKDIEELASSISNISSFDKEKVIAFKEKFMSSCDGNSTKRIIEEMRKL